MTFTPCAACEEPAILSDDNGDGWCAEHQDMAQMGDPQDRDPQVGGWL